MNKNIEEYKFIVDEYLKGKSTNILMEELGISGTKVRNALSFFNIKMRSRNIKKYTMNEDFFSEIDTEDKAYFLGLLHADGCNNGQGFYIKLQERDKELLEQLKSSINYNGELKLEIPKNSNWQNTIMMNIHSPNISKDLSTLGCVRNKTILGRFPDIKESLIHHFIRGYFDGDGTVYITKSNQLSMGIVGNTKIITIIKEYIEQNCNLKMGLRTPRGYQADISIIECSGNVQCSRIYDYLYKDSTIYLKRKKDKFYANYRTRKIV